jgi:hypothetical protein
MPGCQHTCMYMRRSNVCFKHNAVQQSVPCGLHPFSMADQCIPKRQAAHRCSTPHHKPEIQKKL